MAEAVFSDCSGVVVTFDESSGLGTVESVDGVFRFHCIEIADESRSIKPGTAVTFNVVPRLGAYEAAHLAPTTTIAG